MHLLLLLLVHLYTVFNKQTRTNVHTNIQSYRRIHCLEAEENCLIADTLILCFRFVFFMFECMCAYKLAPALIIVAEATLSDYSYAQSKLLFLFFIILFFFCDKLRPHFTPANSSLISVYLFA